MLLRNEPVDAPSLEQLNTGGSPVIWQTILWIMLSLALNSMSQQSGRYRIYLASSPLFSFANTLGITIRFVANLYMGPARVHAEPDINTPAAGRPWPRWLFFAFGPLPAAIKLCSFVGTPWTKTWGILFISSFFIAELLSVLDPAGSSAASLAEMIATPIPRDVTPVRHALRYTNLDTLLVALALLVHCALVVWAGNQVRLGMPSIIASVSLNACHIMQWFNIIFVFGTYGFCAALLVLWLVFDISGRKVRVGWILGPLLKVACGSRWDDNLLKPPPRWIGDWEMFRLPWAYLAGAVYLGYRGMNRLCRRWPRIGEVLLVTRKGDQDSNGENAARSVDILAWFALCLWFTNLVVSVLWYAFVYDPTGTLNPNWTEVFG
ncbi:hypothetical protein B0H19DRAFT_1192000 [Mycena capillaripes]|nr:hypothetical protein B0H19DRAFT_1192000 [Mycena capillaripes]